MEPSKKYLFSTHYSFEDTSSFVMVFAFVLDDGERIVVNLFRGGRNPVRGSYTVGRVLSLQGVSG